MYGRKTDAITITGKSICMTAGKEKLFTELSAEVKKTENDLKKNIGKIIRATLTAFRNLSSLKPGKSAFTRRLLKTIIKALITIPTTTSRLKRFDKESAKTFSSPFT
jgi:hypothetical protein